MLSFFIILLTIIDNYRLSEKLFNVRQLLDTTQLHHEYMAIIFASLSISFYYT